MRIKPRQPEGHGGGTAGCQTQKYPGPPTRTNGLEARKRHAPSPAVRQVHTRELAVSAYRRALVAAYLGGPPPRRAKVLAERIASALSLVAQASHTTTLVARSGYARLGARLMTF